MSQGRRSLSMVACNERSDLPCSTPLKDIDLVTERAAMSTMAARATAPSSSAYLWATMAMATVLSLHAASQDYALLRWQFLRVADAPQPRASGFQLRGAHPGKLLPHLDEVAFANQDFPYSAGCFDEDADLYSSMRPFPLAVLSKIPSSQTSSHRRRRRQEAPQESQEAVACGLRLRGTKGISAVAQASGSRRDASRENVLRPFRERDGLWQCVLVQPASLA